MDYLDYLDETMRARCTPSHDRPCYAGNGDRLRDSEEMASKLAAMKAENAAWMESLRASTATRWSTSTAMATSTSTPTPTPTSNADWNFFSTFNLIWATIVGIWTLFCALFWLFLLALLVFCLLGFLFLTYPYWMALGKQIWHCIKWPWSNAREYTANAAEATRGNVPSIPRDWLRLRWHRFQNFLEKYWFLLLLVVPCYMLLRVVARSFTSHPSAGKLVTLSEANELGHHFPDYAVGAAAHLYGQSRPVETEFAIGDDPDVTDMPFFQSLLGKWVSPTSTITYMEPAKTEIITITYTEKVPAMIYHTIGPITHTEWTTILQPTIIANHTPTTRLYLSTITETTALYAQNTITETATEVRHLTTATTVFANETVTETLTVRPPLEEPLPQDTTTVYASQTFTETLTVRPPLEEALPQETTTVYAGQMFTETMTELQKPATTEAVGGGQTPTVSGAACQRRKDVSSTITWCKHCKQNHCCEVLH